MIRSKRSRSAICAALLSVPALHPAAAEDAAPPQGCFERVYAAAHLGRHRDQVVRRLVVEVGWNTNSQQNMFGVRMWLRGKPQVWRAGGPCKPEGGAWQCRPDTDGDPGIAIRAAGAGAGAQLLFSNPTRLKVYDDRTGPGLNETRIEGPANRDFQLVRVAGTKCDAE